jgi:serine/threonine-protein kinase
MHGVAAAHRVGVIHRDLKPDNLFLCREADGRITMKVLDFGISSVAVAAAAPNHATLTQAGMLLGSLAYMSPEQLGDSHAVDARTDVYAFGVILYEVLTGRLPFEGATVSALAVAIVTGQPPRPSTLRPGIPLALEDIVVRAFARDRLERYPEMSSLIDALAPFTAAEADGDFRASVVRRSTAGIGDHASGAHGERSGARARAPVWLALGIGAVLLGLAGVVYQRSRGEHFSPFFQRGEARTPLPPAAAATPSIPAALAPAVVPEPPPASADEAASVVPVPVPAPAQPARESRALSRSQGARRVSTKSKPKPQHTAAMPESALFSGRK